MQIRTATIDDLDIIAGAEQLCFTPEEAADIKSIERRLKVYPDHFWLLLDEDGKLISFVDGLVTDNRDLTDRMYEDESIHDESGAWQMIFGFINEGITEQSVHGGIVWYQMRLTF